MSDILDMVAGGGLLPYVYCKKITLENGAEVNKTNITLNLELYQSVNALSGPQSSWLTALGDGPNQFLDSMFIQIVKYTDTAAVEKLYPSWRSDAHCQDINAYTAKQKAGNTAFPDGHGGLGKLVFKTISDSVEVFCPNPFRADLDLLQTGVEDPIQVSVSSLLGNLAKKDVLLEWSKEGKVREEIIKGQAYYVIPFEYKIENFDEQGAKNNLGLVFYTFLDFGYFFNHLEDPGFELPEDSFYQVATGPVNAEVVYINGEVQQKREAFFLPSGLAWEGSVHHHGPNNPAPDGYQGDGGLSGLDPASPYRGWMVGEKHQQNVQQEKLRLARVHNNKISDFRSNFAEEKLEGYLAFDDTQKFNEDEALLKNLSAVWEGYLTEKLLGPGNTFLSPFQKERKKYFLKGANISKEGKLVGSSNDSEFSKLYVTRDIDNNARGIFFINLKNLLENNSNLYPILFDLPPEKYVDSLEGLLLPLKNQIMSYSRLLELKLYRDRVDRHVINTKYEEYLNDSAYEEPSVLIGTISDLSGYKTPIQSDSLTEITLSFPDEGDAGNPFVNRYFMFTDKSVGEQSAGLYRYRVELAFKDGTYEFLYDLLKEAARMTVLLDDYYNLSVSTYKKGPDSEFFFDANMVAEEYKKANFVSYFKNGSFDVAFSDAADARFSQFKPWDEAPALITDIFNVFGFFAGFDHTGLANMIRPTTGSPRGINYFIKLLSTCTKKLQKILGTTKITKAGSELDNNTVPDGYTLNSQFDFIVSPSEETIYEQHSFGSPSELFEGVMNEDVYMDYLSIGNPLGSNFTGLRKISPDYYMDRARLDAAKFSPLALDPSAFNGVGTVDYKGKTIDANIGLYVPAGNNFAIPPENTDSLSRTAYSYLTPSIVEFSDPSDQDKSFKFYYSAFSQYARTNMNANKTGPGAIFSNLLVNYNNYDRLLISLLNYSKNKQNYIDADTTNPYYWQFNPENVEGNVTGRMETRDAYKRVVEQDGLTLHDSSLYPLFFDKDAGPTKEKISSPDVGEKGQKDLEDFSDGKLFLDDYYKKYMPATGTPVPNPAVNPYNYSKTLPNSFKYASILDNRNAANRPSIFNTLMDTVYSSYPVASAFLEQDVHDKDPFLFFQTNLTAKIEVFRGAPFPKNDEQKNPGGKQIKPCWTPLTIGDINAVKSSISSTYLCRTVLYDEKFSGAVRVPILDRYFLLSKTGINVSPNPPQPGNTNREYPVIEWERDNHEKIREFRTLTEKGIRDTRRRDPLRPPPIQPDPDPTRSRGRRRTPDPRSRIPENERDTGRTNRAQPTTDITTDTTTVITQTPAVTITPTVEATPSAPDMTTGGGTYGTGGGGGTGGTGGGGGY